MSTVRGKAPLKIHRVTSVEADSYALQIKVTVAGFDGKNGFTCVGRLETWCATKLIQDLRRALRKVRDEASKRLVQAVEDAEGPL